MVRAVVVDFVGELGKGNTVLAFLVRLVLIFAFLLYL